jgi:hypothetical protein
MARERVFLYSVKGVLTCRVAAGKPCIKTAMRRAAAPIPKTFGTRRSAGRMALARTATGSEGSIHGTPNFGSSNSVDADYRLCRRVWMVLPPDERPAPNRLRFAAKEKMLAAWFHAAQSPQPVAAE